MLYTGPIVFQGIIPLVNFEHFMSLHTAVRILASVEHCQVYNEYTSSLLSHFVKTFSVIYGPQYVSYNVHGLVHIADDVKKYGPLDSFSAFQFENNMQFLKKLVRKADKPLQQIANRVHEIQAAMQQNHKHKQSF